MLKSPIYKKYFPVKTLITNFDEKERRVLCRWAQAFKHEVLAREIEKTDHGYGQFKSYRLDKYDR